MAEGVGGNSSARLRSFIERAERLEEEIRALNADKSEVFKEAKSVGYDPKVLKRVISVRRMDPSDRVEQDDLFNTYWRAIHGADNDGTPIATRVHVHESAPAHDPETGEIQDDEQDSGEGVSQDDEPDGSTGGLAGPALDAASSDDQDPVDPLDIPDWLDRREEAV